MKSPRHRRVRRGVGFQMLSKEAQERLIKYEYAVIWLMVLIAITSIVWSISLHILSGDFNNGVIGAKLIFQERDFQRLDKRAKDIFYKDLGTLINETYTEAALDVTTIKTTALETTSLRNENQNQSNNNNTKPIENTLSTTDNGTVSETTTQKPKKRKIPHVFQISSNMNHKSTDAGTEDEDNDDDDDDVDVKNNTVTAKTHLNMVADRRFLASTTVDIDESLWRQSAAVQFVYSFPFLTEIMAIIWTAMCLVFQSGVNKYWGLPKPWRIVVPSIFIFSLMTLGTIIYTIITNRYLRLLCTNLKAPLSDPNAISCGQAISVLRPIIKRHQFSHDVYLNLFRISYISSLLLWAIALIVMILRYVFAIDFQLVDVRTGYQSPPKLQRSSEMCVIKPKSPPQKNIPKLLHVDERVRHKSEDDFQSAKSHLSEVATPLLEYPAVQPTKKV